MTIIRSCVQMHESGSTFQKSYNVLRSNKRYSHYGVQSLLLTIIVLSYYFHPLPSLTFSQFVRIFTDPGFVLLQTWIFAGGLSLAIAMGAIAGFRKCLVSRHLGVIGGLASANFLCEYISNVPLWKHVMWGLEEVLFITTLPSLLAYEYTGNNEAAGVLVSILIPLATWIIFRRHALSRLNSYMRRRPAPNID